MKVKVIAENPKYVARDKMYLNKGVDYQHVYAGRVGIDLYAVNFLGGNRLRAGLDNSLVTNLCVTYEVRFKGNRWLIGNSYSFEEST